MISYMHNRLKSSKKRILEDNLRFLIKKNGGIAKWYSIGLQIRDSPVQIWVPPYFKLIYKL